MNIEQWRELAEKIGKDQNVDPHLILAIIQKESGGNPYAARYEPHYKWLYHPRDFAENLNITHQTEEILQMMGIGLMQVQGAVIRERGYSSHLSRCFDPQLNIWFGTKHLKGFLERYGSEEKAVSSYNQGSPRMINGMYANQKYVDGVFANLRQLRALK